MSLVVFVVVVEFKEFSTCTKSRKLLQDKILGLSNGFFGMSEDELDDVDDELDDEEEDRIFVFIPTL